MFIQYQPLPTPETEPADWALFFTHQAEAGNTKHTCFLAYETARDYLSTPRCFQVLGLETCQPEWLSVNEFWIEEYLEDNAVAGLSSPLSPGIYTVESASKDKRVLMLLDEKLVEFECAEMRPLEKRYHASSARAALLEYLTR